MRLCNAWMWRWWRWWRWMYEAGVSRLGGALMVTFGLIGLLNCEKELPIWGTRASQPWRLVSVKHKSMGPPSSRFTASLAFASYQDLHGGFSFLCLLSRLLQVCSKSEQPTSDCRARKHGPQKRKKKFNHCCPLSTVECVRTSAHDSYWLYRPRSRRAYCNGLGSVRPQKRTKSSAEGQKGHQ